MNPVPCPWPPRASRSVARPLAAATAAFAGACLCASIPAPAATTAARAAHLAGLPPAPAIGLSIALMAGLVAWHLARSTVSPLPAPHKAAMAAALIPPVLLPDAGVGVFLPALLLVLPGLHRSGRWRFAAPFALLAAFLGLEWIAGAPSWSGATCFIIATGLLSRAFRDARPRIRAANDNPLLTRTPWIPSLYLPESRVTFGPYRIRGAVNHVHIQ